MRSAASITIPRSAPSSWPSPTARYRRSAAWRTASQRSCASTCSSSGSSEARPVSCSPSRTPKVPITAIRRRGSRGDAGNELISVVVATYNRPDALGASLRSLARQTDRNFEIVVADDGSAPQTGDMIRARLPQLGVPLKHVWQEDRGFRLAEIRNRAIAASSGGYLVFLDGDCIVPSGFVAAHRALAEPGFFVGGNRALLSRSLTEAILANNLEPER